MQPSPLLRRTEHGNIGSHNVIPVAALALALACNTIMFREKTAALFHQKGFAKAVPQTPLSHDADDVLPSPKDTVEESAPDMDTTTAAETSDLLTVDLSERKKESDVIRYLEVNWEGVETPRGVIRTKAIYEMKGGGIIVKIGEQWCKVLVLPEERAMVRIIYAALTQKTIDGSGQLELDADIRFPYKDAITPVTILNEPEEPESFTEFKPQIFPATLYAD